MAPQSQFTVDPQSQHVILTGFTVAGVNQPVFSDSGLTTQVTWPQTITGVVTYYVGIINAQGILTVTQLDGTALDDEFIPLSSVGNPTVYPVPTFPQVAADESANSGTYETQANAAQLVPTHVAATDPHGDRAFYLAVAPYVPHQIGWNMANPLCTGSRNGGNSLSTLYISVLNSGPDGCTINQLDCNVQTATASAVYRAGLWQVSNQSRPFSFTIGSTFATLLADAGTVDCSTTGHKVFTLGTPLVLPANTWFAVGGVSQTALATMYLAQNGIQSSPLGTISAEGDPNAGSATCLYQSTVTGALGDFIPAGTYTVSHGVGIHRSA